MPDINSRVQLVYPPAPEVLEKASKVFCAFVQDMELYFRVGDADDGETDAGGWQDINATHTVKLNIYYLDTGTEAITVTYTDDGATEYTETIVTKGDTGLWKRAHKTLEHTARFNHSLYEDFNYADFYLSCDNGALYLGEVLVKDTATKVAALWQATDDPAAGNVEFQSDNFVTGSAGFYINGDIGDAEFNNVTVRGTIYATAGAIANWSIGVVDANTISSTGVRLTSGATAYISFGATPPTGPTTGTGVYVDKTGLFGLVSNVQTFSLDAATGILYANKVTLANGTRAGYGYAIGDPLLVCHFDGPRPFETDYSGNLNGHKGQVGTAAGGVIFRPGTLNGKAVQLAEATTNMVLNPSAEAASNFAAENTATVTRDTTYAYVGTYAYKVVCNAGQLNDGINWTLSALSNAIHYATIRVRGTFTTNSTWTLDNWAHSHTPTLLGADGNWSIYGVQFPAAEANGSTTLKIRHSVAGAETFYIDAVQVEAKSYATPYCDGTLGSGHSWSGTAHASTSARTAASLYYDDAANFNPTTGSMAGWFYQAGWATGTDKRIAAIGVAADANSFQFRYFSDNNLYVGFRDGGSNLRRCNYDASGLAAGWHHIAATWSATAGAVYLYVDGVLVASYTASTWTPITMGTDLYIGSTTAGANQWNGRIDDLIVTDFVLSAVEVKALFLSYAPVIAETGPQEFYLTGAGTGSVKGNSRGIFGMDAAGGAAFALLTTDGINATYWGGASETLNAGDLMMGSNATGKANMLFDASAGTLAMRLATTNKVLLDASGNVTVGEVGASKFNVYLDGDSVEVRNNTTVVTTMDQYGFWTEKSLGFARHDIASVDSGDITIDHEGWSYVRIATALGNFNVMRITDGVKDGQLLILQNDTTSDMKLYNNYDSGSPPAGYSDIYTLTGGEISKTGYSAALLVWTEAQTPAQWILLNYHG